MATNEEVFNEVIRERNLNVLKKTSEQRIKLAVIKEAEKELPSLVRSYVKEQTKKITTLNHKEISDLVDAAISRISLNRPVPKVIEKTIIKQVEKKESVKYAEASEIEVLKEKIEELKKLIKKQEDRDIAVQYIGTMIPNFNGKNGKVLSPVNGQLNWVDQSGGGITASSDAYTPTNVATDRSFDAAETSLDELANVLGSLIASLQGTGIIQ